MKSLRIVPIIQTRNKTVGAGSDCDPVRVVEQYWDTQCNLCFEYDTWTKKAEYYGEPSHDEQLVNDH